MESLIAETADKEFIVSMLESIILESPDVGFVVFSGKSNSRKSG